MTDQQPQDLGDEHRAFYRRIPTPYWGTPTPPPPAPADTEPDAEPSR